MFVVRIVDAAALVLAACALAGEISPAPGPAEGTEKTPAKQHERPRPGEASEWSGEWLLDGKADQACAIFQHGAVLLLVNERGDFATGRTTEANKLVVQKGSWDEELTGELVEGGKTISWGNGSKWKRP